MIGLSALLALLLACGRAPGVAGPHAEEGAAPLVWPPAPEQARVRLLQVVDEPGDLIASSGAWARLRDAIAGAPTERFMAPAALAADDRLGLVVCDTGIPAIHILDWVHGAYRLIESDEVHPLRSPVGVAIGSGTAGEAVVWVSDSELGLVRGYTHDGEVVRKIRDAGRLQRPAGLAIDPEHGELIVVDVLAHDVKRYGFDGAFHSAFGTQGGETGQFNFPTHIFRFPDGRLAVTDSLNFRVQVLSAEGAPLLSVGQLGDSPGCLSRPKGVVADPEGNLWVVDGLFENIQAFDPRGQLLLFVGSPGHERGQFWLPSGMAIDSHRRLYVADTHNRRVQVFELLGGETLAPGASSMERGEEDSRP